MTTFNVGDIVRPNYKHTSNPSWTEAVVVSVGPGHFVPMAVDFKFTKVVENDGRYGYKIDGNGWDLPSDLALVSPAAYEYNPSQEGDKDDDI